ncbi:MAG: hypothetical protein LBO81_00295 [Clostridiales Family XIII bacterium]|jgi:hypothetical protein|nr:hypothetical protein [Clostridiales Family XIII bacterium]
MMGFDVRDHLPFILLTVSYAAHIAEEYFMDRRSRAMREPGIYAFCACLKPHSKLPKNFFGKSHTSIISTNPTRKL